MYNKLNDEKCKEIIIKFKSGINKNKLSEEYNVSHKTITNIINRNGRNRITPNKKYSVNENYFKDINTEEKAYWLGFLYADGYIRYRSKNMIYAGLLLKDIDHIEKFKISINSNDIIKKQKNKNIFYIEIYNKNFCENLIINGCVPKKTYKIQFPILDFYLIRHFIRGFFDGDGSITCTDNTLSMTICCAKYDFIVKLVQYLYDNLDLDRINNIYKTKNNLYIWSNSSHKDIIKLYHHLYDNSVIYLDRKKNIFDYFIKNKDIILKKIGKNNWKKRKQRNLWKKENI